VKTKLQSVIDTVRTAKQQLEDLTAEMDNVPITLDDAEMGLGWVLRRLEEAKKDLDPITP
jgi:hypothetical protein